MKIRLIPCLQCQRDNSDPLYAITEVELRDDLTFDCECGHGHRTRFIIEAQKFEILFDMGASALLDEYSREAVSSFAAAQERFHEFCIKVFMAAGKVSHSELAGTWKLVANQSERQLGAYYLLKLLHLGTSFSKDEMSDIRNYATFRNKVIHKGLIATREEATDYAEYVYDYIISALKLLKPRFCAEIAQVCRLDHEELLASISPKVLTRSAAVPTMIWLSAPVEKFGIATFEERFMSRRSDHLNELLQRVDDLEEQLDDEH